MGHKESHDYYKYGEGADADSCVASEGRLAMNARRFQPGYGRCLALEPTQS